MLNSGSGGVNGGEGAADDAGAKQHGERVGVFVAGALGAVATTAALGAAAVGRGFAGPTGLVTCLPEFEGAGLPDLDDLVFGGVDVREGSLLDTARGLAAEGVVPAALVDMAQEELTQATARVAPGVVLDAAERPTEGMRAHAGCSPREALARVREAIRAFRAAAEVDRVVVVLLTSVEPVHEGAEALADEAALERFLDAADPRTPPSLVYALAALDEGCPILNFTPCTGASSAALEARARRLGVPHAGRDGKTGETLLKSVLGPMMRDRNLRVLSWAGYNILGNRDGQVLADAAHREAKVRTKGSVLRATLGPQGVGSEHVHIEYVPSIGDWKTAWDHVHFEGFLGTRMALELTWRGADSALAAPLVLDCVRLLARAHALGRKGALPELACFFKAPLGSAEHAFPAQMTALRRFAAEISGER